MSDTPITDREAVVVCGTPDLDRHWVPADICRRLERERAQLYKIAKMYLNMPEVRDFKFEWDL